MTGHVLFNNNRSIQKRLENCSTGKLQLNQPKPIEVETVRMILQEVTITMPLEVQSDQ